MAYIDTIKLVTGDTMPDLRFTLKDSNAGVTEASYDEDDSSTWAPINVAGASLALRIRPLGSTDITMTLSGVVTDGSAGEVTFPFTGSPFTAEGDYEGEVEITFSNGSIQTMYDLVKFKVRSDFD